MIKATIQSVADRAKVSVGTASRILNGGTMGLRRDARERMELVKKIASELGYRPNTAARSLVLKRTFTVGLVVTELDNPVRSRFIELLRRLALARDFKLVVTGYQNEAEIAGCLEEMTSHGVDGLIIGTLDGCLEQKTYAEAIRKLASRIPVVAFNHLDTDLLDTVEVDYGAVTCELTTHLIAAHGLQRVAFVGWDGNYSRRAGYVRAMREAGLEKNIRTVPCIDYTMSGGRRVIEKELRRHAPAEAFVCHNDLVAIGLVAGLRDAGLRVPEDVAVIGIDNIEATEFMNPRLTSAGIDGEDFARTLFEMVMDRIDGKYSGPARRAEIPGRTFFRESCGCRKSPQHTGGNT